MNWIEKWDETFNLCRLKLLQVDPAFTNRLLHMKFLDPELLLVHSDYISFSDDDCVFQMTFYVKEKKAIFEFSFVYRTNNQLEKISSWIRDSSLELYEEETECLILLFDIFIQKNLHDIVPLKTEIQKNIFQKWKSKWKRQFS
mgnify:CR=1 FL=1